MQWTKHSESPDKFHFWTAVSTIASALRRRVWIDMRAFKWTPNFYIIFVAPPGVVAKSTSISMSYPILSQVKGVNFGPSSATWQALFDAFIDSKQFIEFESKKQAMCALTVVASELGTFLQPEDDQFTSFLIDMWDGKDVPFERRTKGDGLLRVENPWLNIIGATTPAWLQTNMPSTMAEGGLTSRIVFVWGEQKRHLSAFPDEFIEDRDYLFAKEKLVEDLRLIAGLKGSYQLDPQAREWGRQWYEELHKVRPLHLMNARYSGYLARKQTHMMKLAIILAAAKRQELVIKLEDLQAANACLSTVEKDMNKVFESIGLSDSAVKLNLIMQVLNSYKRVENKILWRTVMAHMSDKEYSEAILGGIKANLVRVVKGEKDQMVELVEKEK